MKGKVITRPVDLPYGPAPTTVARHKTRWRCREVSCERQSFTESITQVPVGARTTGRLRTAVGAAIGDAARSVAEVAASFAVSWPTDMRRFVEHTARPVVDWLEEQTQQCIEAILFVAIDPAAVYAKALRARDDNGDLLLPNARLVVDSSIW